LIKEEEGTFTSDFDEDDTLSENTIPIFMMGSKPPPFYKAFEMVGEETDVDLIGCVVPKDVIPELKKTGGGVVVCYASDNQNMLNQLALITTIRKLIQSGQVKVIVVSKEVNPAMRAKFKAFGITDIFAEPVKVDEVYIFLSRAIAELTPKLKALADAMKEREEIERRGSKQKGVVSVPALKTPSDFWLSEGGGAKKIMGSWEVKLTGPGPRVCEWVDSDEKGGKKEESEWQWKSTTPDDDTFVPEKGHWIFQGEKPEFDGKVWVFKSKRPDLSFIDSTGEVHQKFFQKKAGGKLHLTIDSESAFIFWDAIVKTIAEPKVEEPEEEEEDYSNMEPEDEESTEIREPIANFSGGDGGGGTWEQVCPGPREMFWHVLVADALMQGAVQDVADVHDYWTYLGPGNPIESEDGKEWIFFENKPKHYEIFAILPRDIQNFLRAFDTGVKEEEGDDKEVHQIAGAPEEIGQLDSQMIEAEMSFDERADMSDGALDKDEAREEGKEEQVKRVSAEAYDEEDEEIQEGSKKFGLDPADDVDRIRSDAGEEEEDEETQEKKDNEGTEFDYKGKANEEAREINDLRGESEEGDEESDEETEKRGASADEEEDEETQEGGDQDGIEFDYREKKNADKGEELEYDEEGEKDESEELEATQEAEEGTEWDDQREKGKKESEELEGPEAEKKEREEEEGVNYSEMLLSMMRKNKNLYSEQALEAIEDILESMDKEEKEEEDEDELEKYNGLESLRKGTTIEPTLVPLAMGLLSSEIQGKSDIDKDESAKRFCEYFSKSIGEVDCEIWVKLSKAWHCAGSAGDTSEVNTAELDKANAQEVSLVSDLLLLAPIKDSAGDLRGYLAVSGKETSELDQSHVGGVAKFALGIVLAFQEEEAA